MTEKSDAMSNLMSNGVSNVSTYSGLMHTVNDDLATNDMTGAVLPCKKCPATDVWRNGVADSVYAPGYPMSKIHHRPTICGTSPTGMFGCHIDGRRWPSKSFSIKFESVVFIQVRVVAGVHSRFCGSVAARCEDKRLEGYPN